MISSSFNLSSSISFRTTDSGSTTTSSAVANIVNFNETISSDTITIQDDSKTLQNILTNIIKVIDTSTGEVKGEILIDPENDIEIDTSNSDYNTITITLPTSDFDQLNAIFAMY